MSTSELMQWVNSRYVALSGESAKVQQLNADVLVCRNLSAQWDTRVAEWLKRTQGEAAERVASISKANAGTATSAAVHGQSAGQHAQDPKSIEGGAKIMGIVASPDSGCSAKLPMADARALNKLKEDLRELEDYVPWNAVVPSWGSRRAQWARRLKESPGVQTVARHLIMLEEALMENALHASWRVEMREDWAEEVMGEVSPQKVRRPGAHL